MMEEDSVPLRFTPALPTYPTWSIDHLSPSGPSLYTCPRVDTPPPSPSPHISNYIILVCKFGVTKADSHKAALAPEKGGDPLAGRTAGGYCLRHDPTRYIQKRLTSKSIRLFSQPHIQLFKNLRAFS